MRNLTTDPLPLIWRPTHHLCFTQIDKTKGKHPRKEYHKTPQHENQKIQKEPLMIIPPRRKTHTQTCPFHDESKRENNTTETLHHMLKKHNCTPPILVLLGKPDSERRLQPFLIIQNTFKTSRKHTGKELGNRIQNPTKRN